MGVSNPASVPYLTIPGAVGDGITDDAGAIQAVLNDAKTRGGHLGEYMDFYRKSTTYRPDFNQRR